MAHSNSFLAAFIRGIHATAPQAEDDERIERHSVGRSLEPAMHVFHLRPADASEFREMDSEYLPQAA